LEGVVVGDCDALDNLNDLLIEAGEVCAFLSDEPTFTSLSLDSIGINNGSLGLKHQSAAFSHNSGLNGADHRHLSSFVVGVGTLDKPLLAGGSLAWVRGEVISEVCHSLDEESLVLRDERLLLDMSHELLAWVQREGLFLGEPDFLLTESDLGLLAVEDEFWGAFFHGDGVLDTAKVSFGDFYHLGAVLDDSFMSSLHEGLRTTFKSGHYIVFIQDVDVLVSTDLDNVSHFCWGKCIFYFLIGIKLRNQELNLKIMSRNYNDYY
jgi:hypothetical protein